MHGKPLGEIGDAGFCGGVSGNLGERSKGVHGADVDDTAGVLFHHVGGKVLGRQQNAHNVQ